MYWGGGVGGFGGLTEKGFKTSSMVVQIKTFFEFTYFFTLQNITI